MILRTVALTLIATLLGCTAILAADDFTFRDSASGSGGAGAGGSSSAAGGGQCGPAGSIIAPKALWSERLGDVGDDSGRGIAFAGTAVAVASVKDGDWNSSACGALTSKGYEDAFYAQFDSIGMCTSIVAIGGQLPDYAHAIATSASMIVVAGETTGIGGGDFPALSNGSHAFAAAFGSGAWKLAFDGPADSTVLDAALDPNDNVVLTGRFASQIDFGCVEGGTAGTLDQVGSNETNVFVAKRNAAGACLWSVAFGATMAVGSPNAEGTGVATDATGNVFATGTFHDRLDITGTPLIALSSDLFVAKLDAQGNPIWSIQGGAIGPASGHAIAFDQGDNSLLLAGAFTTSLTFGPPCPVLASTAAAAAFVVKLDASNGACIWGKAFGTNQAQVNSVAVGACGDVVFTGTFGGDITFGGATLHPAGTSIDMFLAKLDKDGGHVWSQRYGDLDTQIGRSIAVAPDGNIAVTGEFQGRLNFGDRDLDAQPSGTMTPTSDIFVAVFPPR